jgi:hypothetical protein
MPCDTAPQVAARFFVVRHRDKGFLSTFGFTQDVTRAQRWESRAEVLDRLSAWGFPERYELFEVTIAMQLRPL